MCYAIIQAESKQAGQTVFQRGLLNWLQQEYQAQDQLQSLSLQGLGLLCHLYLQHL